MKMYENNNNKSFEFEALKQSKHGKSKHTTTHTARFIIPFRYSMYRTLNKGSGLWNGL